MLREHKIEKMQKRVRAVIIKNNKILLIKRTKKDSVYWVIPGGAVEENETSEDALKRECKEELLEAKSQKPETKDQKEYFYLCDIINGVLGSGNGPEFKHDSSYVGNYDIEWKNISDLKIIDLKPKEIRDLVYERYKS
jgi:hypothetical protein